MATVDDNKPAPEEQESATPGLPDYMTDPNAVLKDANAEWRYKNPPDYQKTRAYYSESKRDYTFISHPYQQPFRRGHSHLSTLNHTTPYLTASHYSSSPTA